MRRSSICLVVLFFLSSLSIAQHTSSAPAAAPSTPAPPAHVEASAPAAAAVHSAPPPSVSESHAVSATPAASPSASVPAARTNQISSAERVSDSATSRVTPAEKVSSGDKITSAPRIGEPAPEKDPNAKSESDLRHRVCEGADCKNNPKRTAPEEADLRHRVCPNGHCECPPGETAGKTGCVVSQPAGQCLPGDASNGANCTASTSCPAGQVRSGGSCQSDCSTTIGITGNLIVELRSARRQKDEACQQDPAGSVCQQADGHYHVALSEYQGAWASAPATCRTTLPVPDSL